MGLLPERFERHASPDAANVEENAIIALARRRLGAYSRSELMIRAGLYEPGSDPDLDAAVEVWPALDEFIGRSENEGVAASFAALERCLEGAPDMAQANEA